MSMRNTYVLAEDQRVEVSPEQSQAIHEHLAHEINSSKHASRFGVREFPEDLDRLGRPHPLDASYSYLPAREDISPEHIEWLSNTVGSLVMLPGDWEALVTAFSEIYSSDDVQRHKALGGNILFICNHQTYADLPSLLAASAIAKLMAGQDNPQHSQDIITHRLINLFQNDLIKTLYEPSDFEHQGGFISDDVLLVAGGQVGTLPSSGSGYDRFINRVPQGGQLRKNLNGSTVQAYKALRKLSGRDIFMAPAGTEMEVNHDIQRDIEATYASGTTKLIAGGRHDDMSDVMVIPLYIYTNPFTGKRDTLLKPQPTPFAFLAPRFIEKQNDVHQAAWEISAAGSIFKPSGKYRPRYNPPGPNILYKDRHLEFIYTHAA